VYELRPGDADLNYAFRFWTANEAWERGEAKDKSKVHFARMGGPDKLWNRHFHLFDYSYLRLTPHRYWWGRTVSPNNLTMSSVPPEKATWTHGGVEKFGDETCDVVDSAQRAQRLWIGRDSGRVRGVLTYFRNA